MQGKVHANAMPAVYAGIDVCKERLDIYLHPAGERFSVANDAGGWRCLRRRLALLPVAMAALEATSNTIARCIAGFTAPASLWLWSIRCGPACSPRLAACWPRPTRSTRACWRG